MRDAKDQQLDHVKKFLEENPQVAEAMDQWSKSTLLYEEAFRQFLSMPLSYNSTSSVGDGNPNFPTRPR
ncbi:hypothetical protein [Candidatus Binatus sp.]|uniref:hypothetical protein n=1 Tax=Candidatus Binatus sp. TaxID=2811406 RepID=UPI003BB21342